MVGNLATTTTHVIIVGQKRARLVEISDELFLTRSAALLPGESGSSSSGGSTRRRYASVELLATALRHARANAGQTVLVAGHTRGSGSEAIWLSGDRAAWVQALLTGKRQAFLQLTGEVYLDPGREDLERLLDGVARDMQWRCSLADCDDQLVQATRSFQDEYNRQGKAGSSAPDLQLTGVFDAPTWGAFFDTQQYLLSGALGASLADLRALQQGLLLVRQQPARCGGAKPVADAQRSAPLYRSRTDERVEILFFEGGQQPEVPCMAGDCRPAACELFDDRWYLVTELSDLPEGTRRVTPVLDLQQSTIGLDSPGGSPESVVATLGLTNEGSGPSYTGDGTLRRSNANVELYLDSQCFTPLVFGADHTTRIASAQLASGLQTYLRGRVVGSTDLTLALDDPQNPRIIVRPPVTRTVKVKDRVRVRLHDSQHELMPNTWCLVSIADGPLRSDGDAWVSVDVAGQPDRFTVQWGGQSAQGPHPHSLVVRLDWDTAAAAEQPVIRLHNLGYTRASEDLNGAVEAFQYDYQVDHLPVPVGLQNGALPPATRSRLWQIYEARQCNAEKPGTV